MGKNIAITAVAASGLLVIMSQNASAHGYVESPISRSYQAKLDFDSGMGWDAALAKYGSVITEPQGLEALKGFPENGPADGHIASANGKFEGVLDIQTPDYWKKQTISTGLNQFTWAYTKEHSTAKWHYYMTKQGWDQNAPLVRDELELIGTVAHDGSYPSSHLTHTINVPNDRSGYNVILAVWDVADTANAFYQVIDVNVDNDGAPAPEVIVPNAPTELAATNATTSTLDLAWQAPTNTAVKEYHIYRDGKKVQTMAGTTFADTGLTAGTTYQYQVEAVNFNGDVSKKSAVLTAATVEMPAIDEQAPTVPSGVHSMGTTDHSVNLMWTKSSHLIGVKAYDIYRDGEKIGTSAGTMYMDETVAANTTYSYTIKAISAGGNVSEASEAFVVTTEKTAVLPQAGEWIPGTLTEPVEYKLGQKVTYKGKTYETINAHLNYGDLNWAPDKALSLFKEIAPINEWVPGTLTAPVEYKLGQMVTYKGKTYETINAHLNYGDSSWAPDSALSLFKLKE
ncbi:chitin binding domain-containing protein [Brochothrix campestris FSL F6-1037]|uniref:Chitin binding domain-containing protein n=1 Tax=Brochothrix campestris FSL F6-1037 TaxID=1265861 RepID=W7CEL9_9LIST|nr:chitin binding domain-containing protein [Brochothrix campestris FSL F6-1037]